MTKVLLFANNWGGWKVLEWLIERGKEEIVCLVVHPAWNSKFRNQILVAANFPAEKIISADGLRDPGTIRHIQSLEFDIGVSAFFGYILKPEIFNMPTLGVVNLHTGYLPYNRGWHPNVYPILDGSPAGVALHWVEEGIDSGPVIANRRVEVSITDTGGDLHQRLTRDLVSLFKNTWPSIVDGMAECIPQNEDIATHHYRREMRELERVDLWKECLPVDLINLIRGNTYPPYPGAYFEHKGERIYMRMELVRECDLVPGALPGWEEDDECLSF